MSWNNRGLTKAYKGSAAISPYRIVKFGADDLTVSQATAATDLLLGVTNELGISTADVAAGAVADIILCGICEVEFGAAVTRGAPVTADASGRAVAAAPAAGVNNRIIGFAMKSTTAAGDIAPVCLSLGLIQG